MIIETHNLTKEYNGIKALKGVSFSVKEGEIFGFPGSNGAGRTTTINMLTTLLRPTSGYVEVAGYDISNNKDKARRHIGVVFQDSPLDINLTGKENLEFNAMMYKMDKDER
ncbi:daunorubicin/doxorubicin resistance ATP-binding protein DrrA [archaeon]|nr:daunorubicin/doxorubicin resistance ATP-binding protein DrrA [archaeon]